MYYNDRKEVIIWKSVAKKLNGELKMHYQQINGGNGGTFHFKTSIHYSGFNVILYSTAFELELDKDEFRPFKILITAEKNKREKIELSIWKKDLLDKIFNFGLSKTGCEEFDKIIGLKASRNIERYLYLIPKNKNLRNELLNDRYRAYNIHSKNDKVILQRKSELRMKDANMIITEYHKFILVLTGFINAKII